MKKFYILVIFLSFAFQGFSQLQNDTLRSSAIHTDMTVIVYPSHKPVDSGGVAGYVTGTNAVCSEYFMKYSLKNYQSATPAWVSEALVWVGIKTLGSSPGFVKSKIYGVVFDPTANSAEGGYAPKDSALGTSDSVNMTDVQAGLAYVLTSIKYSIPVAITADSFFISVIPSVADGDTIAIASSKRPPDTVSYASSGWVRLISSGFSDFKRRLTYDLDLAIFPVIVHHPLSVNNVENNLQVSIFPNPVSDELYIGYEVYNNEKVKVTLTDMLGRTVSEIAIKNRTLGTYTEKFNVSSLSQGTYLYKVETTTGMKSGKVYISH